jgi:hypothetical protein
MKSSHGPLSDELEAYKTIYHISQNDLIEML